MLLHDVPNADNGAETETDKVVRVELVVQHRLLAVALALRELEVEGDDGDRTRDQFQHQRTCHVRQSKDAEHEEVEGQQ